MALLFSFVFTCERFEPEDELNFYLDTIQSTARNTYELKAAVVNIGSDPITQHGFCWSISADPTVNSSTSSKLGPMGNIGVFKDTITVALDDTTYHVRAFITTEAGTTYSKEKTIHSDPDIVISTITDIDGNIYPIVEIGEQTWMAENLKVTHYADGSAIPLMESEAAWAALSDSSKAYCWYNNSTALGDIYGGLYTWAAAMKGSASSRENPSKVQGVCPDGWHVPSDTEWIQMEIFLGMSSEEADDYENRGTIGGSLRETGNVHWGVNVEATNISGFTALPAGIRSANGQFAHLGYGTSFLTSTTSEDDNTLILNRYIYATITAVARNPVKKARGFSVRCIKDEGESNLPIIATAPVSSITDSSAVTGGEITSDGGSAVTEKGVCWSTSPSPTTTDEYTLDGSGLGAFTSRISGLDPSTTYYVRAYATNSTGTGYGNETTFTTREEGPYVTDIDGNGYKAVVIGGQIWMASNLKTTRLNDGTVIPLITDNTQWENQTTPGYCWYANSEGQFREKYGALYNWSAVDSDRLCPEGWHMPTDGEWTILSDYLGGEDEAGGKLKETGTEHWDLPNSEATNETGFTARGGGWRDRDGAFWYQFANSYWWSQSALNNDSAWSRQLTNDSGRMNRFSEHKKRGFYVRCIEGEVVVTIPVVMAYEVNSITLSSSQMRGRVTADGGAEVTDRGLCWSTSQEPTISDSHTTEGTGLGSFTGSITGLDPNTTYYVRAYATNSAGTGYSEEVSFKTWAGAVTDYDGNEYYTVQIGDQIWMAENLKSTHLKNGTVIPLVTGNTEWGNLSTPGLCWYNNEEIANKETYGSLYNWYTVETRKLCPDGWHVPKDEEWTELIDNLGGPNVAGGKLKEAGTSHWIEPNIGATNSSGWTALPGGYRRFNGEFEFKWIVGAWWSFNENSATEGWFRAMDNENITVSKYPGSKTFGYSVRCISGDPELDLPIVSTDSVRSITGSSAISGGTVTNDGGADVTERGVCWSTSPGPNAIDNQTTSDGSGPGSFTSYISILDPNTTYYIRAYATTSAGTGYGEERSFTTWSGTVTDFEGNVYPTIDIGDQTWMAENLKVTHYSNGDPISLIEYSADWQNLGNTGSGYCWYNNDTALGNDYGALYSWPAVMNGLESSNNNPSRIQGICPDGWHLPSDKEWIEMEIYLGISALEAENFGGRGTNQGSMLKEAGSLHWNPDNTGTNSTRFTALGAGNRSIVTGEFGSLRAIAKFWTATGEGEQAINREIHVEGSQIGRVRFNKGEGFSVRCIEGEAIPVEPIVTTTAASGITLNSADVGGEVTFHGGANVTVRGVCWGTSPNPTLADNIANLGSGIGSFTTTLTGLSMTTKYYVRAFATNSEGTSYGNEISFITLWDGSTVTDIDGNVYNTVQIGAQVWLSRNLSTTRYADGSSIPLVEGDAEWASLTSTEKAYCWFENNIGNINTYGALYTWWAATNGDSSILVPSGVQGACPNGWHIPSDEELKIMEQAIGMSKEDADGTSFRGTNEGSKLKETGTTHWYGSNEFATNETGFTAMGAGQRFALTGQFMSIGALAAIWSATAYDTSTVWIRALQWDTETINRNPYTKWNGYSIRCVRDPEP
jgi:uncharacterized protein (TIGR02145 family)